MNSVIEFEKLISSYYNSPYAIAVDCCTHALELCLRRAKRYIPNEPDYTILDCPNRTYVSVPMTYEKLNLEWTFTDREWKDYYYLGNTNIIDAAVYWKRNGYISGTMMCLSFQYKKHLNVGRGGMILLDNVDEYNVLRKMRYDGRDDDRPWAEQDISTIGYHYYMTPETAQLGIKRFYEVVDVDPRCWSSADYPDLTKMSVFK